MYLPLDTFSPDVKTGIVSASRSCFLRSQAEARTGALLDACAGMKDSLFVSRGECAIVETKEHAAGAARQMLEAGCDAAVLYLGNFSPEIEDAVFVKEFGRNVMIMAAAEESREVLKEDRGDALCGLLSATLAINKRGLGVHIPERPVVYPAEAAEEIAHFIKTMRVYKGIHNATLGLFGPRPRDFETCNYNIASVLALGVEVEEFGLFDLTNEIRAETGTDALPGIEDSLEKEYSDAPGDGFIAKLAQYENAALRLREEHRLSGMTMQCWTEFEERLKHVPCSIHGRLAARGFPVSCENDVYSLVAELMCQYATNAGVTVLDLNHSIPPDLAPALKDYPARDLVGLFHCGNTSCSRLADHSMKHQMIMKRALEPDGPPDMTRGTVEGRIAASPITLFQVHGSGDGLRAYIIEGETLDVDPGTFGATGTAYIPGFMRFYRHALLGRFHHHSAVAFGHCADVLFDALKLSGIEEIYLPRPDNIPYPGENVFRR